MNLTKVHAGFCATVLAMFAAYGCKTTEEGGSQVLSAASEVSTDGTAKALNDGRISLGFSNGQRRYVTPVDTDLKKNRELNSTMGTMRNIRAGTYTYNLEVVCAKAYEFWSGSSSSDKDNCAAKLALKFDSNNELTSFTFAVTTVGGSAAGGANQPVTPTGVVKNWRDLPTDQEMLKMSSAVNSAQNPYADYRPNAAAANLDLPGADILAAMKINRDKYKTGVGMGSASTMRSCLMTGYSPTHWNDMMIHYYCTMNEPRYCYTYATSQDKLSRTDAFNGCAGEQVSGFNQAQYLPGFKHVKDTQGLVFQYVMFAQTNAFSDDQQQAVINEYYGVKDPNDAAECNKKRPRRTEDPSDGTHCLAGKTMKIPLAGRGR